MDGTLEDRMNEPGERTRAREVREERHAQPTFAISKQAIRQTAHIELVRANREAGAQSLGYTPRPFVLCNFPHRRPVEPGAAYERYNGDFVLRIVPDPALGVPYGRDRIWPIYLSTLAVVSQSPVIRFSSASQILDLFAMPKGGAQFERLIAGFKRIFSATIIFGAREEIRQQQQALQFDDPRRESHGGAFVKRRFHFVDEARLWYDRQNVANRRFSENTITLNKVFFDEIIAHPIPTDLEAVRALASSPGALDLYMWLSYRCFNVRGEDEPAVPLFGPQGLVRQLGSDEYARERDFQRQLELWLHRVRGLWPQCPARLSAKGDYMLLRHAVANHPRREFAAGETRAGLSVPASTVS